MTWVNDQTGGVSNSLPGLLSRSQQVGKQSRGTHQ